MACKVCGDTATVDAHVVPRALYRILAGDQQHAYEGSRFKEGVRFQAKGLFDRSILCQTHERMLSQADDYGVRFLRNFEQGAVDLGGASWVVANPRPDLLLRFVAACVWRRGVSAIHRDGADLDLGLAEPKLRQMLFGDAGKYKPLLLLKRRQLLSQGQALREIMWAPGKAWGFGDNTWSFFVLGCEFVMKLNPYSHPPFYPRFVANDRNPVHCVNIDPEEISKVAGMVEIGANMLRPEYRKRRGGSEPSR